MKYKKGFTLLELLVIIAIIGILSGVILTFLMSARNKSKDSSIKQELNHLRTQVALQSGNGTIGVSDKNCNSGIFANDKIRPLLEKADPDNNLCWSDGTSYIVAVPLKTDDSQAWCVDSNNNSRQIATPPSLPEDYICP